MTKPYSFKDVSGLVDSKQITFTSPSEGEPIGVDFVYFDKEGVAWRVQTQGYRTKTGEVRKQEDAL